MSASARYSSPRVLLRGLWHEYLDEVPIQLSITSQYRTVLLVLILSSYCQAPKRDGGGAGV